MNALSHIIGPDAQVRKALDKVRSATLIEDKRSALADLANIAKTEPVAASVSFPVIVPILSAQKDDGEMVRSILETLIACLSSQSSTPPQHGTEPLSLVFAKEQQYITILLDLLEERDWGIRLGVLKILNILAADRVSALQQAVLSSPQGLARLMDILGESEIIRNEVLLVMVALTKGNSEVQKIMVFEGAFDSLFSIVKEEEEGSIILVDCLAIINNLLHGNQSNAIFFREMGGISTHIMPLMERPITGSPGWEQLWLRLLEVVGNLLSPQEALQSAQTLLGKQGVLLAVAEVCTSKIVSKAAKAASLRMLGVLVHKHTPNRLTLSTYVAKVDGTPLLRHLLAACLHERPQRDDPAHEVNTAAAFCWKCYLTGNVDGQQHLAASLMPQPDDDLAPDGAPVGQPIGRLLIASLMAAEEADGGKAADGDAGAQARVTEVWGAATVLAYILEGNGVCQEIAVATPLELPLSDKPPEQLLRSLVRLLTRGGRASMDYRAVAALLRLLCVWTFNCPRAAEGLLGDPAVIMCLLGLMATPAGAGPAAGGGAGWPANAGIHLRGAAAFVLASCLQCLGDEEQARGVYQILESRVGLDTLQEHMDLALASDALAVARRREVSPAAGKASPDDAAWGFPVYDADAAAMLLRLREGLPKCLFRLMGGAQSPARGGSAADAAAAAALARERDALQEEVARLRAELDAACAAAAAAAAAGGAASQARCEELEETLRDVQGQCQRLARDGEGLAQANRLLEDSLAAKDALVAELRAAAATGRGAAAEGGEDEAGERAALEGQVRTLRERLASLEATDRAAAGELRAMAKENEDLRSRAAALEAQLAAVRADSDAALEAARADAAATIAAAAAAAAAAGNGGALEAKCAELERVAAAAAAERDGLAKQLRELEEKHKSLTEEHEDLLVMLADQQDDAPIDPEAAEEAAAANEAAADS